MMCVLRLQVDGLRVTGMDPNPYMFDYARASARSAGLPDDHLDLKLAAAEQIPAQDASFDTVICTLVISSTNFHERTFCV